MLLFLMPKIGGKEHFKIDLFIRREIDFILNQFPAETAFLIFFIFTPSQYDLTPLLTSP